MEYRRELGHIDRAYNTLRHSEGNKDFSSWYIGKKTRTEIYLRDEVLPKFNPREIRKVLTGVIYTTEGKQVLCVKYIMPKEKDYGKNRKVSGLHIEMGGGLL